MSDDNLAPGDLAIVIETVLGMQVGAIVQCVKMDGMHTLHGRMWLVNSKTPLVTEYGNLTKGIHCPEKWLRKIKPGELDQKKDVAKLTEADLIKQVLKRAEKLNW